MKKKKIAYLVGAMCIVSLLAGCGIGAEREKGRETEIETGTEVEAEVETGTEAEESKTEKEGQEENKDLQLGIYSEMMDELSKDNVTLLSPTSLNYALGMVSVGSDGKAMGAFSDYFGVSPEVYAKIQKDRMDRYLSNEYVTLNVANQIAFDKSVQVEDSYKEAMKQYYDANVVDQYDFLSQSEEVSDVINQFCSENTNGLIKEAISPSNVKESRFIAVNALYFLGNWVVPFQESRTMEKSFYGTAGEKDVPMMNGEGEFFFKERQTVGFSKSYEGGQFEFVGILPSSEICDEDGNFRVEDVDIRSLLNSRTGEYDVNVKMPRFKAENTLVLTDALKSTVLAPALASDADFSGITQKEELCISDIIQKVVVDVNEKGTEAAAVTEVIMKTTAVMEPTEIKEITLDRPFLFLIYDRENDEILFMGKVANL